MKDLNELYPVRRCEFEENDGIITVFYKREKLSFIDKLFFKKLSQKPYKIDLDEIGSFIWGLCDGKNDVRAITGKAEEHFGEKIEPAEERIHLFIKQLNRNKLIQLFVKKGDDNRSD